MKYAEAVEYLYSLGNEVKTAKLGLDRIEALLMALGAPHTTGRFVHVAGTNGKGSTCAMIASGLRGAALRVGLFTSPHLEEPVERIQIGAKPVERDAFAAAFARVHDAAARLLRDGVLDMHPTYFETVTAMAFCVFAERGVDCAVIEVGLGGRLDATNVVRPELCVITPVDFDHQAFLGDSLAAIAAEKAGILKPGVPAVFSRQRPEAETVLSSRAAELGVAVSRSSDWDVKRSVLDARGTSLSLRGPADLEVDCPLAGEHQVENMLTAARALVALGIAPQDIAAGIGVTDWPGRLERVATRPEIILDGAHNPAGAKALARYIERFYTSRTIWVVLGAMQDKAIAEMASVLAPLAHTFVVTAPDQARAARPEAIAGVIRHPDVRIVARVKDAIDLVRRHAAPGDAVFVTGSLFLVGEARRLLVQ